MCTFHSCFNYHGYGTSTPGAYGDIQIKQIIQLEMHDIDSLRPNRMAIIVRGCNMGKKPNIVPKYKPQNQIIQRKVRLSRKSAFKSNFKEYIYGPCITNISEITKITRIIRSFRAGCHEIKNTPGIKSAL